MLQKNLLQPSKWINLVLTLLLFSQTGAGQSFSTNSIYKIENGDSVLTEKFVSALCSAARNHMESTAGKPSRLEQLILTAADAPFNQDETPQKTYRWHSKFGQYAMCLSTGDYPESGFIRQAILSNNRDFANIIGPKNRLALNITKPDQKDQLDMFGFVDKKRADIEAKHNNRRFEFQQDQDWKNIMFFYFLFSEYKINYGAKLKE